MEGEFIQAKILLYRYTYPKKESRKNVGQSNILNGLKGGVKDVIVDGGAQEKR